MHDHGSSTGIVDIDQFSSKQIQRRSRKKEWLESKKQEDPTFIDRIREMGKEYARRYRERLKENKDVTFDQDVLRVLISKISTNHEDSFVKTKYLLNTDVNGVSLYNKMVSNKRRVNSILIAAIYICIKQQVKAAQFVKQFDISLPTLLNVSKEIEKYMISGG